ncbi:hypothetical protein BS47DRAFT_1372943 [Hydnum rufescens UP504]|uniref:2-oxoisovalerate dehydrogenase subunit alpha n=1 Tax=Hydnum rufescens UP504 TaxID=1448309 RepID=A0A9P6ATL0_9AGAM|nr:hypothetical protein BS47DRAFT_1372943 [Hydnum rufescens UP504]
MDNILYNVQRQGKISFYHGEEASIVGSAAALGPNDEVLGQYREMGVLVWRGCSIDELMAQCLSTERDAGKGRQMPVHFGAPRFHFHTISSPLATQLPQAAGVAYAIKRDPARRGVDCVACYFGEGGWDSGKGPGYGIDTIRVDGNDALAVFSAVTEARRRAVAESKPVLVEAMTYRVGHHSTSDDNNPLHRMRKFLELQGWWSLEEEDSLKASQKKAVLTAFQKAEKDLKPSLTGLFTDVYSDEDTPWNLVEQRKELRDLLKKYGDAWEPYRTERAKFKGHGNDL